MNIESSQQSTQAEATVATPTTSPTAIATSAQIESNLVAINPPTTLEMVEKLDTVINGLASQNPIFEGNLMNTESSQQSIQAEATVPTTFLIANVTTAQSESSLFPPTTLEKVEKLDTVKDGLVTQNPIFIESPQQTTQAEATVATATPTTIATTAQSESSLVAAKPLTTLEMVEKLDTANDRLDEFQQKSKNYLQIQEADKNQLNIVQKTTPKKLCETESGQNLQKVVKELQQTSGNSLNLLRDSQTYNKRIQLYIQSIMKQLVELLKSKRKINLSVFADFESQIDEIKEKKSVLNKNVQSDLNLILNAKLQIQISEQNTKLQSISSTTISKEKLDLLEKENIEYLENLLIQEQVINSAQDKMDEASEILKVHKKQLSDLDKKLKQAESEVNRIQKEKETELQERKNQSKLSEKEKQQRQEAAEKQYHELIQQRNSLVLQVQEDKKQQMIMQQSQNATFNMQIMGMSGSQSSFYRIFIVDESGSMYGTPFDQAIRAIRQMLADLQAVASCNDSFCLIQFGSSARTLVSKTPIKGYNVGSLPNNFGSGGTNFESAFIQAKTELQRTGSDRPQIIFLTDGGDSDRYKIVLREITNSFKSKNLSMFCIGCGGVDTTQLKNCLKIVNDDEQYLTLSNGDKVQTLFSVNDVNQLCSVFSQIRKEAPFDMYQITQKKELLKQVNLEYEASIQNMSQKQLQYLEAQITIMQKQKNEISSEQGLLSTDIEKNVNLLYEDLLLQAHANKKDLEDQINKLSLERQQQESEVEKCSIKVAKEKKQLLDQRTFQKPTVSRETMEQFKEDQRKHLNEFGFLSIDEFNIYSQEVEKCLSVEQRQIDTLNSISENMFYAYIIIEQLKLGIRNYEETLMQYVEPTTQELQDRFIEVLQIKEKLGPEELVMRVLTEVLPSFERRVQSLKNPELFKQKILAPLLSEEMWPTVKKLVFVKTKELAKSQTFDEFSQEKLFLLYGSEDADLKKKLQALNLQRQKVSRFQAQLDSLQERKTKIQDDLKLQLDSLQKKIDKEFEKKFERVSDDPERIQALEEAKAERLVAEEERAEEMAQNNDERLEKEIERIQGDLDINEEKKMNVQLEHKQAFESFLNRFQTEFDLILAAFKYIRIAVDRMEIAYKDHCTKVPLLRIIDSTMRSYQQLMPEEERRKLMNEES